MAARWDYLAKQFGLSYRDSAEQFRESGLFSGTFAGDPTPRTLEEYIIGEAPTPRQERRYRNMEYGLLNIAEESCDGCIILR